MGADRARTLWELTERGLRAIQALAGDAYRQTGSLRLASDESELAELQLEFAALAEDGFAVEWLEPLPAQLARFAGGMLHSPDGSMHPARWVRRLAQHAADAGAELRERSRVSSLAELVAPTIVIATDGYTHGLVPVLDALIGPIRNQVVVTEPLPELLYPLPHYARHGYDYWQQTPDRRLVAGGRRDADESGEHRRRGADPGDPGTAGGSRGRARRLASPRSRIGGPASSDRVPTGGRSPARFPDTRGSGSPPAIRVTATCSDSCAVELVAAAILGEGPPELELFDPARVLV